MSTTRKFKIKAELYKRPKIESAKNQLSIKQNKKFSLIKADCPENSKKNYLNFSSSEKPSIYKIKEAIKQKERYIEQMKNDYESQFNYKYSLDIRGIMHGDCFDKNKITKKCSTVTDKNKFNLPEKEQKINKQMNDKDDAKDNSCDIKVSLKSNNKFLNTTYNDNVFSSSSILNEINAINKKKNIKKNNKIINQSQCNIKNNNNKDDSDNEENKTFVCRRLTIVNNNLVNGNLIKNESNEYLNVNNNDEIEYVNKKRAETIHNKKINCCLNLQNNLLPKDKNISKLKKLYSQDVNYNINNYDLCKLDIEENNKNNNTNNANISKIKDLNKKINNNDRNINRNNNITVKTNKATYKNNFKNSKSLADNTPNKNKFVVPKTKENKPELHSDKTCNKLIQIIHKRRNLESHNYNTFALKDEKNENKQLQEPDKVSEINLTNSIKDKKHYKNKTNPSTHQTRNVYENKVDEINTNNCEKTKETFQNKIRNNPSNFYSIDIKTGFISKNDENKIKLEQKLNEEMTLKGNIKCLKKVKKIEKFCKKGFSGAGTHKVNQDCCFVKRNFLKNQRNYFIGVCDGHGQRGEKISEYISKNLPNILEDYIKKECSKEEQNKIASEGSDISKITELITTSFSFTNKKINTENSSDCACSGTTCVSALITPSRALCANVGDSRCVLGRFNGIRWSSVNLSRDHKPSDFDEYDRIINSGGKVEPYRESDGTFSGPDRVWMRDKDVPGLAMSRSFGDSVAHKIGVIAIPEVIDHEFTEQDKFIIFASDGLWEFISSDEAVFKMKDYYLKNNLKEGIELLYKESSRRWMNEEGIIDDTTIVVVSLDKE